MLVEDYTFSTSHARFPALNWCKTSSTTKDKGYRGFPDWCSKFSKLDPPRATQKRVIIKLPFILTVLAVETQ